MHGARAAAARHGARARPEKNSDEFDEYDTEVCAMTQIQRSSPSITPSISRISPSPDFFKGFPIFRGFARYGRPDREIEIFFQYSAFSSSLSRLAS